MSPAELAGSRDFVLHLGFPKTATTALQRGLFRHDPAIAYLGKLGLHRGVEVDSLDAPRSLEAHGLGGELARDLVYCSPQRWREVQATWSERVLAATDAVGMVREPVVLSNEDIVGSTVGLFRPVALTGYRQLVGVDPDALAQRLAAFAEAGWPGRVSVLLTLRRQDTFLASFFAQTFQQRWAAFAGRFERFAEAVTADQYYSLGGLALDYDWLIGRLQHALGPGNVHVVLYEDIACDPDGVAQTLHRVTGVDAERARRVLERPSWMVRATGQKRWRTQRFKGRNRLRHTAQWLQRRVRSGADPRWIALSDAVSERVMARYAQSNRRLAERLGRSLAWSGYHGE